MSKTIDFENLRLITDGDQELEKELFLAFLGSSAECISNLVAAYDMDDEEDWKHQAHALKGICLNLGAILLGELSKKAQEDYRATKQEKEKMLNAIQSELTQVRQIITPLLN